MKVDSAPGVMQSQLPQAATGGKDRDGFLAMLESAKQHSSQATQVASSDSKATPAAAKTAAQELEEFLRKTPIQHLRDAILKEMGLTEEDLKSMPPEKRAAVEETIAAKIKEKLLGKNDVSTGNSAQSLNSRFQFTMQANRQPIVTTDL